MEYETILVDTRNQVGVIRLNRPKVLNAMNRQLWTEMMDALDILGRDDQVKALIITGEGRAFSTGADLKDSKGRTIEAYRQYLESLQEASKKIMRFEKPTIAAINGYALGSGYELALAWPSGWFRTWWDRARPRNCCLPLRTSPEKKPAVSDL